MEEVVWQLKENSNKQAAANTELTGLVTAMSLKYEQLTVKFAKPIEFSEGARATRQPYGQQISMNKFQTKFSRLNFPTFNGENPSGWVYKCERFFKYNGVEEKEIVNLESIHLERKALEWFQGCEASAKNLNWRVFSTDMIIQFGPGKYENLMG